MSSFSFQSNCFNFWYYLIDIKLRFDLQGAIMQQMNNGGNMKQFRTKTFQYGAGCDYMSYSSRQQKAKRVLISDLVISLLVISTSSDLTASSTAWVTFLLVGADVKGWQLGGRTCN